MSTIATSTTRPVPVRDESAVRAAASRLRRRLIFLGILLVGSLGFVGRFHRFFFDSNLGVVVEGRVYRGAQPTRDLPGLIDRYKLGSILNLRGGSSKDPWYATEVEVSERSGIEFFDLPMSAVRRPSRSDLLTLLDLFDRCRYPLFIHCKSGSDRTGLAVGLYLMSKHGTPPEEALKAFTIEYGHVPLFGPERLHEPFREYAAWLDDQGLSHSPERLRHWIRDSYRSNDPPGDVPSLAPGSRHANPARAPRLQRRSSDRAGWGRPGIPTGPESPKPESLATMWLEILVRGPAPSHPRSA